MPATAAAVPREPAARAEPFIRYSPAIELLAIAIASSNNFADPDLRYAADQVSVSIVCRTTVVPEM